MPWKDKEKEKEYNQKYHADYYLKNKESEKERVAKRRKELREWVQEYKGTLKCSLCPEDTLQCLDFHHLDPTNKEYVIGDMLRNGFGKKRIMQEIDKCIVLCANCHRKVHAGILEIPKNPNK